MLGQSSVLSAGNCSINLALPNSSLSTPASNPKALVLSLAITFPEQAYPSPDGQTTPPTFVGTHEVYASGTSAEGLQTGPVDLGSLVVSQGQDFTLTLGTSESFVNLGTGATLSLPLSATGLNGFTGSITLNTQIVGGSGGCFVFMGTPPTSIAANSQTTITVRNNNCTSGYLDFIVVGTLPGNNIFHSTSYAMLQAMPTGDFNIGVSGPYPAVLSPQTGVSYTVTVSPTNGLTTGCVSLSLGPGSLPAGVTYSLPSAVCLNGSGSVTASLNFSASPITPPGTWPLQVTGTLGSSHTAALSLSTQVTTFQVTSATGSAIVHNTGQEVQTVHSVTAGNVPSNATCAPVPADSNVTCRVVSSSPGTVTIGITAGASAVHGTRVLNLNGGAAPVLMAVADYWGGSGLPTITVDAGGSASLDINLPVACDAGIDEEDESCGFGATVTSSASWISSFDGIGVLTIFVDPPAYTPPGSYSYSVNLCGGFWDPGEEYPCEIGPGDIEVEAAPPPAPVLTCSPSSVIRGTTVTCAVTGSSVTQWSFSGDGIGVSGPSGGSTWSGIMVFGGTITAIASGQTLTANVTVNPRANFPMLTAPTPAQVANGSMVGPIQLPTLTSPPTTDEGSMGQAAFGWFYTAQTYQITSGPNLGLVFITSFTDNSAFGWELNPGLTVASDPFYQHQGNCFAPVSQIVNAVQAHEAGVPGPSHYSQLQAFLAIAANNPATVAESVYGSSVKTVTDDINQSYQAAFNAAAPEPPGNLSNLRINYPPYQTCGQ